MKRQGVNRAKENIQVSAEFKKLFDNFEQKIFSEDNFYLFLGFHYLHGEKEKGIIKHIADLLNDCSKGDIPDYNTFQPALANYCDGVEITNTALYRGLMNGEKEVGGEFNYRYFILIFTYLYVSAGKTLEHSNEKFLKHNNDRLQKVFKKIKLLISLFQEKSMDRIFQAAEAFRQSDFSYIHDTDEVADDLENVNGNEIMSRLGIALKNNMADESRILVGALANRSDILTPGEYHYFRAAIELKSGEYQKAIKYAKKIAKEDNDYIQACYILLEAYASLGDADSFFELYKKLHKVRIENAFLLYLLQSLIYHMDGKAEERERSYERAHQLLAEKCSGITELDMKSPNTRIMLRNRARLSYIYVKECRELDLYCARADIEEDEIEPLFNQLCKKGVAAYYALKLDHSYLNGLLESMTKTVSEVACYIGKNMFIPVELPLYVTYADYDISWEIYYELEGAEAFLENVDNNIKYIGQFPQDSRTRWLAVYYNSAILYGPGHLPGIQNAVKKYAPALFETSKKSVAEQKIYDSLSQNGKSLYQSANAVLDLCIKSDYGWKDAGMLSLGFFRIIENELNERVLKPVLKRMDRTVLEECCQDLMERKKKNSIHIYTEDNKLGKYNMNSAVTPVLKLNWNSDRTKNLMLSDIEFFFNAISDTGSTSQENTDIRKKIQSAFVPVLTEEGMRALREDRWSKMIEHDIREDFRNPPAHAKYLHIDVAIECKKYVQQCLMNIVSWVQSSV